jgi:hypothetical protein
MALNVDANASRNASEGAEGPEFGVRAGRTVVPALRATAPCGSNFHGSDHGKPDQLKIYGVLRYAQVIALTDCRFCLRLDLADDVGAPASCPASLVTHDNTL